MQAMLRWLDPILNPLACLPAPEEDNPAHEKAEAMLKRLEALLQHRLRYALSGDRRSIMRGQGLDFADLREYMPGDDIRKIDWSVFARTLTPHVREYHEEKQLTLWLAVDCTPSMRFGKRKTKLRQAVELAALLGLLAERGKHKLGAVLILGQETQILPPKSGTAHLQHIMQKLLDYASLPNQFGPTGTPDPLPEAFRQLAHLAQKNSTVLVFSDFLSLTEAWHVPLGQLSQRAKLVHLVLQDSIEIHLPAGLGILAVQDPETGETVQIDTNDTRFRQRYKATAHAQTEQRLATLKQTGLTVSAPCDAEPLDILASLLPAGRNGP